jgi:hypothetical protein
MQKTEEIRFRVEPGRAEKLRQIKRHTGVCMSELMRRMIDGIEVAPTAMKVTVNLSRQAESDGIRQDSTVAFTV